MTDADHADDIVLANTPAQDESLLHSLEQVAEGIDFSMNSNKTEFKCFNQEGTVFTLSGKPLKLWDQFIYLSSDISSKVMSTYA